MKFCVYAYTVAMYISTDPTAVTIVDPIEELKKQIECAKSEKVKY